MLYLRWGLGMALCLTVSLAATFAISRSNKLLYVTSRDASALDRIDLDALTNRRCGTDEHDDIRSRIGCPPKRTMSTSRHAGSEMF